MSSSVNTDQPLEDSGPLFGLGRAQVLLLIGFLATIVVADRVLHASNYAALVPREHMRAQLQLIAHATNSAGEDVLVVGSSRAEAAIDPARVQEVLRRSGGIQKVVNRLVVQGLRPWMLHRIIADQVTERPPRELLVVSVEPRLFFITPWEGESALGLRLLGSLTDWTEVGPWGLRPIELREWALAPTRGIQAPWNLDWLLDPTTREYLALIQEHGGKPPRVFGPMTRQELAFAQSIREQIKERKPDELPPAYDGMHMLGWRKVLDECAALPCRVVFVRMPVVEGWTAAQNKRHMRTFEEVIVPGIRAAGFEYVDLNREPFPRTEEFFKNETHVNEAGMELTSQHFGLEVVWPALDPDARRRMELRRAKGD
jgi:hypothetical protein